MRDTEPCTGEQDDPAVAPPFGINRHTRQRERLNIPQHRPPGHLQTLAEIGLMIPGPASAVDETITRWVAKGVHVVEEPHDDAFGRTFVVADPDGNLIRVSPVD